MDRYAEPPGAGADAHPMDTAELVDYLKSVEDFNIPPWIAVMEKVDAMGDPATPSREQTAILRWLGKGLELWEKQYPLEGRLGSRVRHLKPLAAALAVTDPGFLQPGAHPLHQMLDSIHERAVGWQSRLDRVGAALEQQVTQTIENARGWFDDHSTDLALVAQTFSSAAEKDQARARRMVQRVVETEAGKLRTAEAKSEAAHMINAELAHYDTPEEIGEFLTGPWFTSAQLLFLKFGAESEEWQLMTTTTHDLLDSLQALGDADDERRQYIFEAVTELPKRMRRWLLSLHHDTEAVNESMGLVERAHLRILREQPIELTRIAPIVVIEANGGQAAVPQSNAVLNTLKQCSEGQWFIIKNDDSVLRAQLVLKIEQSQQMVFANMAGVKALQLSYENFDQLLTDHKITPIHSGASFSLCLAQAAGVDTIEILNALAGAMQGMEPAAAPAATLNTGALADSDLVEILPDELDSVLGAPEDDIEAELEPPSLEELERHATAEPSFAGYLSKAKPERPPPTPQTQQTSSGDKSAGSLAEQAQAIKPRAAVSPPPPTNNDEKPAFPSGAGLDIEETSRFLSTDDRANAGLLNANQETSSYLGTIEEDAQAGQLQVDSSGLLEGEAPPDANRQVDLPMGVWIGFHDGEAPTMARLAVFDPNEDCFIFVNRQGVKIRIVSRQEMLSLIDHDMVDILQITSNFREVVTAARKNLES
ncbi:DUF1631 family protein [Candidatus Marimicrobium litorale]|uniref:DUF1631 family protein n=1 Tax=Candidatus Marimicrobium litorale TaxID=2518991 RepID=A0ABT3T6F6_9GAMM|nr:DUF1631 family protein [Candidatus Marimicrobium litorale]MCX2977856.1 DUF1631 family protein [Candidatus Marimicrobium litorale]